MTDDRQKSKPRHIAAIALIIGPLNAEAATGFNYRWCRDTAARLGVPFVGAGRKRGIRADLFIAALEREQQVRAADQDAPVDPAEHVRAIVLRALNP